MKKGDFDSNRGGFTIIEVALVIAIAGLIFLMVFIALPGLRTSQRDAERREDVTLFLDSVKDYQTNNRGALPGSSQSETLDKGGTVIVKVPITGNPADTTWAGFYKKYLGDRFIDPNGENYQLIAIGCNAQPDVDCADNHKNNYLRNLYNNSTFPNDYKMYVVTQSTCSGDRPVGTSNPRKLSVIYKLEGAGIYCAST